MPRKPIDSSEHTLQLGRRGFLGTVAIGAAGTLVTAAPSRAQTAATTNASAAGTPVATLPDAATTAAETAVPLPAGMFVGKTGSDFMVDVIKTLDIDYVAVMPGSTFRALHESVIDYGNNTKPELISCLHEEISVSMAHGYAKVAGKPMLSFVHGVVGLQHASMSIYNAWADRAPVLVVVGNMLDDAEIPPGVDYYHSAQDNAAMVRDFTKWDDMPVSLEHFAESMIRARNIAMTPPFAPTVIVADGELAEREIGDKQPVIPTVTDAFPPVGDPAALAMAAKMLVAAEQPVIIVDRMARSQKGVETLVALAEALGAPVIDLQGRMNMPSRHPLNLSWSANELLPEADLVLGLEVVDLYGTLNRYRDQAKVTTRPILKPRTKIISVDSSSLLMHSNFKDYQRYQAVDLEITGDGEETLPYLLEAIKQAQPSSANVFARTARLQDMSAAMHQRLRLAATYGWDASPISVPRFCMDLYSLIEDDDWALVTPHQFQMHWQIKLWNFTKYYQHIGDAGGYGVGYQGGAALGAAMAHRDAGGRLAVAILGDGELMCNPGSFWTAAHHEIPLLMVMHNNRAYNQELMHIQRMADRHARGIRNAHIGTTITSPNIDYAKLAESMGVWSEGPISDPQQLKPALQRALDIVRQGKPALVDVVSQPR
jgi:acetolactate synthase-1/2/3 large subunit